MFHKRWRIAGWTCLLMVLVVSSCGKSEETAEKKKPGEERAKSELLNVARLASKGIAIEDEAVEAQAIIEQAGYKTKYYDRFPAEELGKKGRVLIYSDKKGKKSGGVIFMKKTGNQVAPGWHWYFEDMVPDSVVPVESNDDGLWDVKVVSTKGRVEKFVQDQSFTLMAKDRSDWIAMNGQSSPPISAQGAMWHCFDGDTVTAWRSSVAGGSEAFLELITPFGVQEGLLTVQTLSSSQPRRCALYADGKKIQQFELESTAGRQSVRLDKGVQGAKRVRLVFESVHNGDIVAVAELALK
jgi:hypothetical protein